MKDLFNLILGVLASLFKSRAKLEAEILILRQQINVLRQQAPALMFRPVCISGIFGVKTIPSRQTQNCASFHLWQFFHALSLGSIARLCVPKT